jgi:two-component system CheB/CheR fusion protein
MRSPKNKATRKKETPAALKPASPVVPAETSFPIVGIGASAGGLAAFEAFFSGMPADVDPGMAFVLVQHLAPDHKSILTDLIRRYTRMQVFEVEDGMAVKPNCTYIIPPNRDMAFLNGSLHLIEPSAPRGQRMPIDFFFRSLAQDQGERAVCIVLSGTGSDGTQGLRAIKGEGGMAVVQTPESTEYDGMPRSAIATGLVDYELPPAEMAQQLMAYASHAFGRPARVPAAYAPAPESALKKVFILLRSHTGHDFSQYKPSTIHRRIERRLAVHQIETIEEYVSYLRQSTPEVEALFRDLLIGVTSFFRDPIAFEALEREVIPALLNRKPADSVVRVWSPACSSGEEPYSIAILLQERQDALKRNHKVQIFATDIDPQAIATARAGLYPASVTADISPERLARYFSREPDGGGYRIHKAIRDLLVFSEQDVIKDPPFSRLDLISCRNLLIYMGADLQRRLLPLFHYALSPGGMLLLGSSETVGEFGDLFDTVDRAAKLYQRKESFRAVPRAPVDRFHWRTAPEALPDPPPTRVRPAARASAQPEPKSGATLLRELTERTLLQQTAPAGALVSARGEILYLHGRTGMYLEPAPGEAGINNIVKMAREGLQRELAIALHRSVATRTRVRCPGLHVRTNGSFTTINLTVLPVPAENTASEVPLYLVTFEEVSGIPHATAPVQAGTPGDSVESVEGSEGQAPGTVSPVTPEAEAPQADATIASLARELRDKEEYLQTTLEELETSTEELKSSNEEMQSVNEELQSTNEELETSKEELQSVNEEMATVNAELQTKVADLSRANNDMNNLLGGTGIATVFVDHQLRILRFTPAATSIINLIRSDVGRPIGHVVSNLVGYDRLVPDAQSVLDTLIPKELDVRTTAGNWYSLRIQPYRTVDNVIEGAVITFVDVTKMKLAEAALQDRALWFRQLADSLQHLVWTCGPDGLVDYLSPQWLAFTGVPLGSGARISWLDQVHADDRAALTGLWKTAVAAGESLKIEFRLRHHAGTYHWFEARASALRDSTGRIEKWFGVCVDITDRRPS